MILRAFSSWPQPCFITSFVCAVACLSNNCILITFRISLSLLYLHISLVIIVAYRSCLTTPIFGHHYPLVCISHPHARLLRLIVIVPIPLYLGLSRGRFAVLYASSELASAQPIVAVYVWTVVPIVLLRLPTGSELIVRLIGL
jgi:hypothetical protein